MCIHALPRLRIFLYAQTMSCSFPTFLSVSFNVYIEDCVCCGLLISNLLAELPYFGTVDCCYPSLCIVAADIPWFGLQLSCFGHVRAKTISEFPCGLELCSLFVWDYPRLCCLLHRDVKGGLLLVCSGWSSDCAGLVGC